MEERIEKGEHKRIGRIQKESEPVTENNIEPSGYNNIL